MHGPPAASAHTPYDLEESPLQTYDVTRDCRDLYAPKPGDLKLVDVPEMGFLMIDGHGDPNTSAAYREAVEALYVASCAVRTAGREQLGRLHTVAPLEGLWSAARLHDEFLPANGLAPTGGHHEISLSDPRRTEPAGLRTVLRQPVTAAT